jgi:hypothetical protein
LSLFPTAYFPPIQYLISISKFDIIEIECEESFPKQTLRNRTYILSSNGVLSLSVPLKYISKQKTKDVIIDDSINWRIKHLRAIQTAYASSPYFDDYYWKIESILKDNSIKKLLDLNTQILIFFNESIDIDLTIKKNIIFCRNQPTRDKDYVQSDYSIKEYYQVFKNKFGFISNLSFLDLLMNEGPMSRLLIFQ